MTAERIKPPVEGGNHFYWRPESLLQLVSVSFTRDDILIGGEQLPTKNLYLLWSLNLFTGLIDPRRRVRLMKASHPIIASGRRCVGGHGCGQSETQLLH
ncbi:hypothetical protein NNRS527_03179 (plasmid) [Nitrosospira sp. NRS527]|nr:hypothetical protein NNRS527_03179 [Nitrosospira sp. NRS527]